MFLHAIPASVAALLKRVKDLPIPDDTFLAGGTAAALYLGHRESIDIDLFTNESFDVSLSEDEWNEVRKFFEQIIRG